MSIHTTDPYLELQNVTRAHLRDHGCGAYTYLDGSLPGVIAAATNAERIVEVGTALGYTALWLSHHNRRAHVDTIEADAEHVHLARRQIEAYDRTAQITVHHGQAHDVLPTLEASSFDMAFFDGFAPTSELIDSLGVLLKPGGTLLCANLTLGGASQAMLRLAEADSWITHSLGETAIAVRIVRV